MYDPEMRKDCPMRGTLGNCSPVGGFCIDAVSDEICEAVHNAYEHGYSNALIATTVTANEIKTLEELRDKYCHWGEVVVIDKVIEKLSRSNISSGVIIPDVEMPKNCHECDVYGLSDVVGLKCPCDAKKELYSYDKRPEECPLKPI